MNIGNYQLVERIYATAHDEFYLARHVHDGTTVLLKLLDRDNASVADKARFRHEYALLQLLHAPEIIRPIALHDEDARLALVLEHFAGECLETVLARERRLALPTVLHIAIQLTRALAALHAADIVHHDIRPANILIARDNDQVRLADLGRATSREHEAFSSGAPTAAGDWAYLSPEQTGRMNRQADYRTDFYSLGITLYRLLTGQLPFQADDPPGWVHCHIARIPPSVSDLIPEIAQPVSDIVLKLLAKVPEDRYQSAGGLLADLEHCLVQWQACRQVAPFALGTQDVSDRFLVPHKLYGRTQETAALLAAFQAVVTTGAPMLVTVSGYSGVGKSALVNELQQPIVEKRGYFISGKFDQYKRDIPYATLAQAFDSLVRQILGESDTDIAHWRDAICEALGPNGQLMVSLIPQLEIVIGPQPPVPELPSQDAQRRFQLVFRRFIGVFARVEHPLVLFLDDLQWLDAGTLALLADLATHPDMRYLLLVGAYRDNEVDPNHPLMRSLEEIREAGGAVQSIVLAPLTEGEVAQLVAASLHCLPAEARPLAQLVLDKTGGNPFFTLQFLTALAEEKLLRFDSIRGAWIWDLPRIHAKGYTDNVVDLMVGKLARLPQDTQDTLAQFACLGNAADVATLGLILGQSAEAVPALLREAVRMGLVFRQEDTYTFLHDRVQEAVYSLIPTTSRAGMHLRIGRILISSLAPETIEERIFEVVSQLNRGSGLVESQEERERIAELNLLAGNRAKAATAYASALAYVTAGAALLTEDCWEHRHALIFRLELNRAECEFLTSALAVAEERLAMLSARAATTVEQATVACLREDLYTNLDRSDLAIEVGLDYLRHLGIDWSPHPTEEEVRGEYERIWSNLGGRAIEELIDLPLMTDPASLATLDVLSKLAAPALFSDVNLSSLLTSKAVNLSLERGNSDGSCQAYVRLGMVAGPMFGDYQAAYRFARLGCDLVEHRGLRRFQAGTYLSFGAFVFPWTRHVKSVRDLLRQAFEGANRIGDLTCAGYCCNNILTNLLAAGDPLDEVQREAEHGLAFVQKIRFGLVIDCIATQLGLIRTLRGLTPTFGVLDDAQFDERQIEHRFAGNPRLAIAECWYWTRKLQARFFAGDYGAAIEAATRAEPLLWTSPGFFESVEYHFYGALSRAACCDSVAIDQRAPHLEALATHHRQLEVGAANCPENFENRAALVGAEIARIEGRELDAERLYEAAIRSAHKNGFVHNEGVAHELAARFYLARGLPTAGNAHLERARTCYAQWGATGKVRQLEERYPQLRAHSLRMPAASLDSETRLDMLSMAKASQAISGSIVLDELIDTLMRLVLENAGAQSGWLLLAHDDDLVLAADASVEQQAVHVRRHAGATPLPQAILQYVRRSREHVLLMDAAQPHPFSADPYFSQQHPKSVLCLPILRQSALVGLLYLENNLTTHAFTPDRVQVLELLASQAAISLENARLYSDVRENHARIQRLVDSNIIGMFFWDLQGAITEANDAFLHMTGYSRDDLQSGALRWTDITPPESREADAHAIEVLKRTGSAPPFEKEFIRKDGSRLPILIGVTFFEKSQETGLAFVLDLSERKRAEAEREARHAAEAANLAKSAFLSNMSHELRTPLNGILGYAQILERDPALVERQLAGVSVIRKSGEHLLTLINDILDLAKIEAGKMELYLADLQFPQFVQSIIDIVDVKAVQKGVNLVCDIAPDLPQWIRADEKRLRQVLLNLLSNAVKFTDRGQVVLRIQFAPPDRLRFEVQDTGVGIAANQLDAIFQPFEQVGETQRRFSGTGLGLTISQQYVRLMGGDIEVESRVGQGSTFRFELEAQPVKAETAVTARRTETGYAGPRRKVLVVDDGAENRAVLTDLLTPLGFEVAEAANGREGLDMAQRLRPHLIVMDIVMPEMDGLEAMRLLRQLPACKEVPIIAVSASVSASDSKKSLLAGGNAFLPKPIDADKLLDRIATLLQLEWRYAPSAAGPPLESEAGPILAPPAHEMEVLHRLALLGNMHEIMGQAEHLVQLDERYRPFASQLNSLARNYQSQAVLHLVERYRKSSGSGANSATG